MTRMATGQKGEDKTVSRVSGVWVDYLIIFIMSLATTLLWHRGDSLAIGGDYIIPFHPMDWLYKSSFAWYAWIDAGLPVDTVLTHVPGPDAVAFAVFVGSGLSIVLAQKLFLSLMYFVGAVSVYSLTSELMDSHQNVRAASLFSALVFLFSPVFIQDAIKQIGVTPGPKVGIPLVLALYVKALKSKDLRYFVLISLASVLLFNPLFGVEYTLLALSAVIFITLIYLYRRLIHRELKRNLVFLLKFIPLTIGGSIIVNLYWLGPFLQSYSVFASTLENFPIEFETYTFPFVNVFRLLGLWTFFDTGPRPIVPYSSVYRTNPLMVVLTFILPILAFSSLLLKPRNKQVVFLSLTTVFVLFFAKGANPPLEQIYIYIVSSISMLKPFYSPWAVILFLAITLYPILIGMACGYIIDHFKSFSTNVTVYIERTTPRLVFKASPLSIITGIFLVSLIVANTWPIVTGDVMVNWYKISDKGTRIPDYYYQVNDWFKDQPGDYRICIVPGATANYIANVWGYQGTITFYQLIFTKPLVAGSGSFYRISVESTEELIEYAYSSVFDPEKITAEYANTSVVYPEKTAEPEMWSVRKMVNADTVSDWRFGETGEQLVDHLSVDQESYVEGSGSLRWDVDTSLFLSHGHQVFVNLPVSDFTPFDFLLLWVKGDYDTKEFRVGLSSSDGRVGWYYVNQHLTKISKDGWRLVGLPLLLPDKSFFDYKNILNLHLRYGGGFQEDVQGKKVTVWVDAIGALRTAREISPKILALLNVRYVLIDSSIDDEFVSTINYKTYFRILNDTRLFTHILTNGPLLVYENQFSGSHFYAPARTFLEKDLLAASSLLASVQFDTRNSSFILENQNDHEILSRVTEINTTQPVVNLTVNNEVRDPTRYVLRVNAQTPFILVFSESYDERWKATIDGEEVKDHFMINGYANGWIIDQTGEYNVIVEYTPQSMAYAAKIVSVTAATAMAMALLSLKILERFGDKKIRLKIKRLAGY